MAGKLLASQAGLFSLQLIVKCQSTTTTTNKG